MKYKLFYSFLITFFAFILRYLYLDSPLHKKIFQYSNYSSYYVFVLLLLLFYFIKNKKISNTYFLFIVILFTIIRCIYRFIIGHKISNNSFHLYNNLIFIIGIFTFSYITL